MCLVDLKPEAIKELPETIECYKVVELDPYHIRFKYTSPYYFCPLNPGINTLPELKEEWEEEYDRSFHAFRSLSDARSFVKNLLRLFYPHSVFRIIRIHVQKKHVVAVGFQIDDQECLAFNEYYVNQEDYDNPLG
jgi:hypothetical protein